MTTWTVRVIGDFEKSGVILERTFTVTGGADKELRGLLKEVGTMIGDLMWSEDLSLADIQAQIKLGNLDFGYRWEPLTIEYMSKLRKVFLKGEQVA